MFDRLLVKLSMELRPHCDVIAMAIIATLLALYGDNINRLIKKRIQAYPFLGRLAIFVLLCTFGFGIFSVFIASLLEDFLLQMNRYWLAPVVIGIFLLIGFLADREKML